MKHLRFALGICAAILVANQAQAQQGPYVTQAAARLSKLIDKANGAGYSLNDNAFSVGGGWLKQSKSDWILLYSIPLQAGTKYRLLAAGDDDAKDVDVEILDAKGKAVAQDVATDPTATVDFTPSVTAIYQIRIRLYDSQNNLPCVCLGILMTGKK